MSADVSPVREYDLGFPALGTRIRLLVGCAHSSEQAAPGIAAQRARDWLESFHARLSRFLPDSELSALNANPCESVAISPLMAAALAAVLWAAARSGGLVDPTLLGAIEQAGYRGRWNGRDPASLSDALAAAPPRRQAAASRRSRWRELRVDFDGGLVRRPSGLRLDIGGSGKGLAADVLAGRMRGYSRYMIDCGGDLRIGGCDARRKPYQVRFDDPFCGQPLVNIAVREGAVATSGIGARLWETPSGGYAHHLLDPATGAPAWTGLVSATALAPTALEAETLAKAALLSGRDGARRWLATHGGLVVDDEGRVEVVGSFQYEWLSRPPRRLRP